jgi:UDP-N-acetylglucosamine 2-epimerase (non-hydrolysing)
MKRRVLCVVGTRPEAVKMAPVVHALRRTCWADAQVLSTGQHRELLDPVLRFFGIPAAINLNLMRSNQSLAELTARMVTALDAVLAEMQPDLVLAQGDTTSVFAAALCSFYRRVAFGHIEAGLRTGNKLSPYPEEMNRLLTGRLADLHFAPTAAARDNLLREGVDARRISLTGNTSIDALRWAAGRPLPPLADIGDGRRLLLVTAHRRENFGEPLEQICQALLDIADRDDVTILFPVHLNPNVGRVTRRWLAGHPRIRLAPPLDYPEFVAAMKAAYLILTDSGGVQEEAPSLGKPVLVLRDTTERPEGVAAGTACLVGCQRERIVARVSQLLSDPAAYDAMAQCRNPYGDGEAAARIVAELETYFPRIVPLPAAPSLRAAA